MDIRVDRDQLLGALGALKFYFASGNEWPFVAIVPHTEQDAQTATLYALLKSAAALTLIDIPAIVTEATEAFGIVGTMAEALVKSTSGEMVRLSSTDSSLFIEDDHKFRGRLARSTLMPSMFDVITQKMGQIVTKVNASIPKSTLGRLVDLSMAFPGRGPNELRWCALSFATDDCSGSVQNSEVGEIESMPMGAQEISGAGTLNLNPQLLKVGLSLAHASLRVQADEERHSAVLLSDPDNDIWWTMMAQVKLPGEQ